MARRRVFTVLDRYRVTYANALGRAGDPSSWPRLVVCVADDTDDQLVAVIVADVEAEAAATSLWSGDGPVWSIPLAAMAFDAVFKVSPGPDGARTGAS